MLQTYSDFAGILNDAHARRRGHRVREGLERGQGRDVSAMLTIARVGTDRLDEADEHVADLQVSATRAVFAVSHSMI